MSIGEFLERPRKAVSGVVNDNINAAKGGDGFGEGGIDFGLGCYIQFNCEKILGSGVFKGEGGRVAGGCWERVLEFRV